MRDRFWTGVMVGVSAGIPATATAVWFVTGVNILALWAF